eukprot:5634682-Pyramimonas_sp.AAC.1
MSSNARAITSRWTWTHVRKVLGEGGVECGPIDVLRVLDRFLSRQRGRSACLPPFPLAALALQMFIASAAGARHPLPMSAHG